nr:unnamed protein product [Digitaria exilis]
MMRQTQATILQKTQQTRSAHQQPSQSRHQHHPPGGSRAAATGSRPASAPNAERFENRLKKPTTFLCKHKFRNELPDPSAQLKWLPLNKDKDRRRYPALAQARLSARWSGSASLRAVGGTWALHGGGGGSGQDGRRRRRGQAGSGGGGAPRRLGRTSAAPEAGTAA